MTNILQSYSARAAADLSGFQTVAMLDYLQRSGVFLPERGRRDKVRGKPRKYSFRDLIVLKAIKRLLDSGASVANLKNALAEFQKINWTADPVTLEDKTGIIRYLIASSDKIYLVRDSSVIVELTQRGQLTFSFIIDLENLRGELRSSLGLPTLQHELELI